MEVNSKQMREAFEESMRKQGRPVNLMQYETGLLK